jgi:hypothetical protein
MTGLASQLLTVENKTSEGTLTPTQLLNLVWSLNYQALYHYGRSPWVEHGYAPSAHVVQLPDGAAPPVGAWNIILLDTSPEAGTLGYHEDEAGNTIPYSDVFVRTAEEDKVDPAEVASHEMLEMLVDPLAPGNPRTVLNSATKEFYLVEVADPVEGCGYDVGAPEGRHTGVTVADFVFPAWFGMTQTRPDLSFRDSIDEPFTLAPQGYISVAPESKPGEWSELRGADRANRPPWASRLERLHPARKKKALAKRKK